MKLKMFRKAAYVFSAAVGSVALGYGVRNRIVTKCDAQPVEVINKEGMNDIIDSEKEVVNFQTSVIYETKKCGICEAINKARDLVNRVKYEIGAPGIVIGVSIDGKTIWKEGFGLADVENRVPCHPDTVMRIASISKSMTMAVVARLWQEGKLDLDKPVQDYVPSFPKKTFKKEEVSITTRQLVSHLAGIRHYKESPESRKKMKDEDKSKKDEFYFREKFKTVQDSLKLFQDDDLLFKPGKSFVYTTHGWTLVSAVVEAVAKAPFTKVMQEFFQVMGLKHTALDEAEPLIYNRASYYEKTSKGRLKNAPYVDNSYKWAGGGFVSTIGDLLHFGNAMLYSYQWHQDLDKASYTPGYLQSETMKALWTPLPGTAMKWGRADGYGMGWVVLPSCQEYGGGDVQKFSVGHTGGAVGASSVLFVIPTTSYNGSIPSGIVVAAFTNLGDVSLSRLARRVAELFNDCVTPKPSFPCYGEQHHSGH